jgi:hypothetical protein
MRREKKKRKQYKSNIRLIYSLQCRPMILENKGEVDTPIVSKIEKDFNYSFVFILLLEGKVVSFIVPLCCVSHVTRAASARKIFVMRLL